MNNLTLAQAMAWVTAGQMLVSAGIATTKTIRAWIIGNHGELSEAQLDEICDLITAGAAKHKAIADGDAGR